MSSSDVSPPPLKRRRLSKSRYTDLELSEIPALNPPLKLGIVESLSIYSWNINGIGPFIPPTTPPITNFLTSTKPSNKTIPPQPSLSACIRRWSFPQIVFLQEVKIALSDTKTLKSIQRAVDTPTENGDEDAPQSKPYDAHFCLPRDKYNATGFGGKVYGVCTLIRPDLAPDATIKTVEWDLEGRVQIIELPCHGIVAYNIYAVNGTTNDYRCSATGKVTGTRHDRKRIFHTLLANDIAAYEAKGWQVVVAGDINVSRSTLDSYPQLRLGEEHVKNRADFEEKFIKGLGMLDTFRLVHGEERKYSYRPRNKAWGTGLDRVDLILVTKGLRERIEEADILDSEFERGPSDHVPLFITLNVSGEVKGTPEKDPGKPIKEHG